MHKLYLPSHIESCESSFFNCIAPSHKDILRRLLIKLHLGLQVIERHDTHRVEKSYHPRRRGKNVNWDVAILLDVKILSEKFFHVEISLKKAGPCDKLSNYGC